MFNLAFRPHGLEIPQDLEPQDGNLVEFQPCNFRFKCGHKCGGCDGEDEHLPCSEPDCRFSMLTDLCVVCHQNLFIAPAIQIACGHIMHAECLQGLLHAKWSSKRITFNFMLCPACKTDIDGITHVKPLSD